MPARSTIKHILPYPGWNGCAGIGEQTRLSVFNNGPDTGSIGSRVTEWTARGEYSLKANQSKRKRLTVRIGRLNVA